VGVLAEGGQRHQLAGRVAAAKDDAADRRVSAAQAVGVRARWTVQAARPVQRLQRGQLPALMPVHRFHFEDIGIGRPAALAIDHPHQGGSIRRHHAGCPGVQQLVLGRHLHAGEGAVEGRFGAQVHPAMAAAAHHQVDVGRLQARVRQHQVDAGDGLATIVLDAAQPLLGHGADHGVAHQQAGRSIGAAVHAQDARGRARGR